MIGRIIGNYQITSELARGGMGMVYRGQHLHLPREVLIKSILLAPFSSSAQVHLKARFRRATFIQSQFDHPNIVRVYEFIITEDKYFLVMEYVQGVSLRDLLAREGVPTPAQAVYLFKQALSALDYAHNFNYIDESDINHTGVIHRDIKPSNLLLDTRGRLKITDFGVAKALGEKGAAGTAQTGFHPGTLEYMSPEQIRGGEIDKRSDIYSMGVTFYEMLSGRLPFELSSIGSDWDIRKGQLELEPTAMLERRPDLSPSLAALVMRAIRKNPADRYQSALDFLDAFRTYEQQQAANGGVRATNGRTNQQPLIVATYPEQEPARPAQSSQSLIENATIAPSEAADQASRALTTKVVSLLKSVPGDSDHVQWGAKIFASLRKQSPRGKLMFAGAALGMILVSARAGVYLFSQQKSGVDTTASASTVEPLGASLFALSETDQNNSGRPTPGSQLNQSSGELTAFKQARVFERQEQYGEAIKIYEEYIVRNPNATDTSTVESRLVQLKELQANLISADAAMTAGKYKLAAQKYGAAIRLKPDSERAKDGFSRALAKMPDYPRRQIIIRTRPQNQAMLANPETQEPLSERPTETIAPSSIDRPFPAEIFRKIFKPTPKPMEPESKP